MPQTPHRLRNDLNVSRGTLNDTTLHYTTHHPPTDLELTSVLTVYLYDQQQLTNDHHDTLRVRTTNIIQTLFLWQTDSFGSVVS